MCVRHAPFCLQGMAFALAACATSNPAPPTAAGIHPPPSAAHAAPKADAAALSDQPAEPISSAELWGDNGELIVGSMRGLEAWQRDGSSKRVISADPALHPRWLDKHTLLVLRPEEDAYDLRRGFVERVSLDGRRERGAQLPDVDCNLSEEEDDVENHEGALPLDVEGPDAFLVDRELGIACIDMMDRNINMANVAVDVRLDLRSGQLQSFLSVGDKQCKAPPHVKVGRPDADSACSTDDPNEGDDESVDDGEYAFGFDSDRHWVWRRNGTTRVKHVIISEYQLESTSPSRRWQLIGGDVEEGDYIHRSVLLLDRQTGELFSVPPSPRAWSTSAPLVAAKGRLRTPVRDTADVVGESDVRWLGSTPESELLVIDHLVIAPGRAIFDVDGEIAR
ncbi:MAG: hypothetical protein ABW321_25620 [Polyangiales bacterium]